FKKYTPLDDRSLADISIRTIMEGPGNVIWTATDEGLFQIKDNRIKTWKGKIGKRSAIIFGLLVGENGNLWICSLDSGLVYFDIKSETFTPISTSAGLFSNLIYQVVEDEHGRFWMSGNKGIFYVHKRELFSFIRGEIKTVRSTSFGKSEGMRNIECSGGRQPAGIVSRDDKVYFPTVDGLVIVDLHQLSLNMEQPKVLVREARFGKELTVYKDNVTVPPGTDEMEFKFTALSFYNPDKIHFKYRLDPFNSEWKNVGSRRNAFYTNIPPGDYTFRVKARNNDGMWSEEAASFRFHLGAYWH
ncbi:MAG: hypothetical protein GY940_32865, partial [bacterium]|nr:hypothetical protein [bacterium]